MPRRLDLVRPIERQRAVAERAEEADVAAIAELRHADRGVARIVGGKVEQRRDPRIRLAVVVAEEALERAAQPRVAIRGLQRPAVGEPLARPSARSRRSCGPASRSSRRDRRPSACPGPDWSACSRRSRRRECPRSPATIGERLHVFEHARNVAVDVAHAEVQPW